MKLNILLFNFLFVFSFSSLFGQEQVIKLNMEEGHEYVFEKIDKLYSVKSNGSKTQNSESKMVFRVEVEKIIPDSTVVLVMIYKESSHERFYNNRLIDKKDIFYPEFKYYSSRDVYIGSNYVDPVLSSLKFNYSINLKNGEITFENRAEVLEDAYSRLKEKKYSDKGIETAIKYINERKLDNQSKTIEFLTWFLNEEINADGTIKSADLKAKFPVYEQHDKFLSFGEQDFENVKAGKTGEKYKINAEDGIITNYSTIKIDSVKSRTERVIEGNVLRMTESNFRLVYSQKVPEQKLVIKGKIENPLSEHIHIRFLDGPFGATLKTKTVLLNADNSFETIIDFPHSGFVYVENENKNKHKSPGTYVFYAEPGDTISFNSTGSELPWKTSFSGSNPVALELLYKIRSEIKLSEEGALKGRSHLVFDQAGLYGISIIGTGDGSETDRSSFIPKIFNLLEKSEAIIKPYKALISERALKFIINETKAYFYNALYVNATLASSRYGIRGTELIVDKEEFPEAFRQIDQIDVHRIYNDFGLHSRICVSSYINYNFTKANKISQRIVSYSGRTNTSEVILKTQFSRMVLTGSPLYRELGRTYQEIIQNGQKYPEAALKSPHTESIEGLELMIQICNDTEIIRKAKQIIRQHNRFKDENYYPPLEMLDINGAKVSYEDIVQGKPTIFCFSSNWIGKRYELDQLALKNPDLRFVFVVEGTSLKQWQLYTERAVPDAEQLLFINDKQSISDIFHDNEVYLVFDSDGQFLGYEERIKESIKAAKESLQPKKKALNKSQLQLIIVILTVTLLAFIICFIIWKWRVRQRFKKEKQFRKLRELELTAIRSQMNPHFLFNSLNSVQNLVQKNMGREAHLYLSDFAGLIRKVLRNSEKEEVSLAEELEMTEQYLKLEKLRFDFDFEINVRNGIDQHNTLVPSMLLQPFVENSVIHGLQNKSGEKRINIEVFKSEPGIKIFIEDNGIGREAAKQIAKDKNGKGTKLVQERLEVLQQKQGENYQLEIIDLNGEKTGTRVEILLPEEN